MYRLSNSSLTRFTPCIRHVLISRPLSTSLVVRNAAATDASQSVAEETQNVTAMDNLLKAVREKSNPVYHSIMPMRTPVLWSEALLKTMSRPEDAHTPPTTQADQSDALEERTMADSYSELVLPFGSKPEVLEQYTNASGGIRTGRLMEHLDSLAGSISYKHVLGPQVETLGSIDERGFYLVTAGVDRLDMLTALNPKRDLRLSGQVIYTGKSSMEVAVKMETLSADHTSAETALLGRFSMVCRDAKTHKARRVNPLKITSPEEERLYALGEGLKIRRQASSQRSLDRVPPSSGEAAALHAYYLRYRDGQDPEGECVWMGETKLEKTMLMFPQERNVHQKIFGGYLMRLAYEIGFANASLFSRGHVRFLSLDGISFARPVPIGSILRLTSHVLHCTSSASHPVIVHVGVTANVVDVKTGSEQTTNEFRFTWCADADHGDKRERRQVVPKTYGEAMLWLEGKRALDLGAEIRGMRGTGGA